MRLGLALQNVLMVMANVLLALMWLGIMGIMLMLIGSPCFPYR